jgi:iron complex outermembrane receptor protein
MSVAKRSGLLLAASTVTLASLIAPPPARAQEPAAQPQDESTLEEVIVTAQRRAERLQDVPVSVSAFSTERLDRAQIHDVNGLAQATPAMTTAQAFSPLDIRVNLRGVSELVPSLAVDPATGVYVDGIYLQTNAGSNLALIDMERVEVLKGPQGTLFGRNTIGGALNITTKKPEPEFGGLAKLTLGNYDQVSATGVVNLPLGDRAGVRVVFQHDEHDGYGRNTLLDLPLESMRLDYVRGSARFEATEDIELVGTAFYTRSKMSPVASKVTYVNPASPLPGLIPALQGHPGDSLANYMGGDVHDTQGNIQPQNQLEAYGFTGTATGHFGAINVQSITGYTNLVQDAGSDIDGSPYTFISLLNQGLSTEQFSQEFQVYGKALDDRLDWIAGLYYFHETGDQKQFTQVIPPLATPPGAISRDGPSVRNTSYAAFIQATYEIMPRLRLTGGIRYTKDERRASYDAITFSQATGAVLTCDVSPLSPATPAAQCRRSFDASFDYVPWTLGLDYKPNDHTLLYAKVSKGFRSGSFPGAAPTANNVLVFAPVEPESLLSPEVGAKLDLLDGRLRVNAAAYYSNYKNIQQNANVASPSGGITNILTNSGRGEIYGGELEVSALVQKLRIDASLGLVQPEYKTGASAIAGQPFTNVSKTTASLAGSYPVELGFGTLTLSGAYAYRSKVVLFSIVPGNAAQNAAVSQKGYGLLDAQAQLELANSPITLSVWGKNITDKEYRVGATDFANTLGFSVAFPGAPATYGGTVSVKF